MRKALDRLFLIIAGLLVGGAILLSFPFQANAAGTRCTLTSHLASKAVTTPETTSSSVFSDVSGTTITKIKLVKKGCIVVQFSGEANVSANGYMYARAFLDNSVACDPADIILQSTPISAGAAARAMNFVCRRVAPGTHTVKMQYRFVGTGNAFLGDRTTIAMW